MKLALGLLVKSCLLRPVESRFIVWNFQIDVYLYDFVGEARVINLSGRRTSWSGMAG